MAETSKNSKTMGGNEEPDRALACDRWNRATDYTFDGTVDWDGQPARRSKTGGWKSAKYIIGQQVFSNLTFFGVAKNLVMYLTTVMHQGNAVASNFVSNWTGTAFIAPLLGAFLADSFWGRYSSTLIFSLIFTTGTTLVAFAAYVPSMYPPQCPRKDVTCEPATSAQTMFLSIGLYVTAISSGALQSPVTALGADQFDEEDDVEKRQKSSFFNWFYQAITVGAMVAAVGIVTIQDVSWGLGMALSAGAALMALVLFLFGSRLYRFHKPGGNALARVAQVFVAATRNCRVKSEPDTTKLYEVDDPEGSHQGRKILHTDGYMFLDKAAMIQTGGDKTTTVGINSSCNNPWKLCTVTQVEEVKCLIRFCPIFLTSVIYTTVYMQLSTLFVVQGATMDTRIFAGIKIAPATLSVIENISVMFWVVVYDQLLVPFVRRYTPNGFTDLQRMGIGLGLSAVAMVVAALVEMKRLSMATQHGLLDDHNTPIPMSVLWETPQYFIIGASEIFTYIGLMEFFYDQSPDGLRSIGSALSLLTNAIGSYISTLLVTTVNNVTSRGGENSKWIPDNLNRGHVDYFYFLLALLSLLNLAAFVICARRYRYLKQEPLPSKKPQR